MDQESRHHEFAARHDEFGQLRRKRHQRPRQNVRKHQIVRRPRDGGRRNYLELRRCDAIVGGVGRRRDQRLWIVQCTRSVERHTGARRKTTWVVYA